MNEHANNDFEARLAAVRPPAVQIDRDRLMYEAGWAAAEARLARPMPPANHWWKAASAVSTLAAVALLAVVLQRPTLTASSGAASEEANTTTPSTLVEAADPVEGRPAPERRPAPPWTAPQRPTPSAPYLALRQAVVAGQFEDVDADAAVTPVSGPEPRGLITSRDLMEQMLSEQGLNAERS